MSTQSPQLQSRSSSYTEDGGRGDSSFLKEISLPGTGSGLLVAGLAAVGVGALLWYYFGPDFRRYMKMKSM